MAATIHPPEAKQFKVKICLVGDPVVGKTSLVRRFVLDEFAARYLSTIGTKASKKELLERARAILDRYKVPSLVTLHVGERGRPRLSWTRDETTIRAESKLDGKYVLETTTDWTPGEVLAAYHQRDAVEKFIQAIKSVVEVRPVYVRTETHVLAHVFVCVTGVLLLALLRRILKAAGKDLSAVDALRRLDSVLQVVLEQAGRLSRATTRTSP